MTDKCPVDHPPPSSTADKCPVDHSTTTRSPWARFMPSSNHPSPPPPPSHLSTERETSTIPRSGSDGNWVYPSEAQFFTAMARKNHDPQAADMKTIVPIHNAVNERAWAEVMKWEAGRGGDVCGGVKLINFKGKPGELSPRARWKMLLGYVCFRVLLGFTTLTLPRPGIPGHLIATTGSLTGVEPECATLSIFTRVGTRTLPPPTSLSFSTSVPPSTTGKVSR
jgi:hypothetical protein